MKQTTHLQDFRNAFKQAGRDSQFSYEGLAILSNHLQQWEDDTGEEIDLDVIALCCDYCEMTELELRSAYSIEDDESSTQYLQDNTLVAGFTDTSIIFQNF